MPPRSRFTSAATRAIQSAAPSSSLFGRFADRIANGFNAVGEEVGELAGYYLDNKVDKERQRFINDYGLGGGDGGNNSAYAPSQQPKPGPQINRVYDDPNAARELAGGDTGNPFNPLLITYAGIGVLVLAVVVSVIRR